MKEKLFYPLLALVLFFGLFLFSNRLNLDFAGVKTSNLKITSPQKQSETQPPVAASAKVLVTRVVDGDTVEIEGGKKVRYIGINTPETVDPRQSVQCFGKEAANKNKELVEGKKVRLEKDVSETDKYGRLLRYVYVGNIFVNEYLVQEGFARATSYPPDIKFQSKFQTAETQAQAVNRGLWGSCNLATIGEQTSRSYKLTTLAENQNCNIKGNISSRGEKIYHLSGQRYYNQTAIDTSKGERWFCSEDEAKAAGWRPSKI